MWNSLYAFFPRYIKERGFQNKLKEVDVCAVYRKIIEDLYPGSSQLCEAAFLKEERLTVHVYEPSLIAELEGNKHGVQQQIIKKTGYPLKKISFLYKPKPSGPKTAA